MSQPSSSPTTFKTALPWIIAAVAVIAMGVTMFVGRGPGAADPKDEELARLTERLDAMEQGSGAGSRLPPARVAGAGSMAPGRGGNGADGLGGMSREVKTPEQMEAEREKQLRELEASFANDQKDPVGGPKTENTLEQTVSGETMKGTGLAPKDVDIACKANSCRIVGSFDKMGDAQDWSLFYITAAGGNVLSRTQMVFVPKPGGKTEVRIYSTRAKG